MSACDAGSTLPCQNLHCKHLPHKLAAWRSSSSSLGVHVPVGWKGPSVYELERRQVQEAADAGIEIDRPPK